MDDVLGTLRCVRANWRLRVNVLNMELQERSASYTVPHTASTQSFAESLFGSRRNSSFLKGDALSLRLSI